MEKESKELTPVEWLISHLKEYGVDLLHHEREIEQAKAMESNALELKDKQIEDLELYKFTLKQARKYLKLKEGESIEAKFDELKDRMTEQQFIEKFKSEGFELYKTEGVKEKADRLEEAKKLLERCQHSLQSEECDWILSEEVDSFLTNKTE